MKIGLVSALMKNNSIDHQISVIEEYLKDNKTCQLLCFGECFLNGFEGLSWDYNIDIDRAIKVDSPVIKRIKLLADKYNCGISFGFVENYKDSVYCTNMVIDKKGRIADIFRRVSRGWKAPGTSKEYREGDGFHSFTLDGIKFATAICGDLWYDKNIEAMNKIDKDIILWPMYIDFSKERWDRSEEEQYIERSSHLGVPALMFNSYVQGLGKAKGGCNVFKDAKLVEKIEIGIQGVLQVDTRDLL